MARVMVQLWLFKIDSHRGIFPKGHVIPEGALPQMWKTMALYIFYPALGNAYIKNDKGRMAQ